MESVRETISKHFLSGYDKKWANIIISQLNDNSRSVKIQIKNLRFIIATQLPPVIVIE